MYTCTPKESDSEYVRNHAYVQPVLGARQNNPIIGGSPDLSFRVRVLLARLTGHETQTQKLLCPHLAVSRALHYDTGPPLHQPFMSLSSSKCMYKYMEVYIEAEVRQYTSERDSIASGDPIDKRMRKGLEGWNVKKGC